LLDIHIGQSKPSNRYPDVQHLYQVRSLSKAPGSDRASRWRRHKTTTEVGWWQALAYLSFERDLSGRGTEVRCRQKTGGAFLRRTFGEPGDSTGRGSLE